MTTRSLRIFVRCLATTLLLQSLPLPTRAQQPVQTKADKKSFANLEQQIPALMAEGDIPGLSIAVIRDARVVWSRGFGVSNSEKKKPVDDKTVFEAASLSKPVFAYGVLKLVDEGKLSLDTPLIQ